MEGALKTREKMLVILGVGLLLAGFLTFYLTFITAYLNPGKVVMVSINNYGEANPEIILSSFSLLLGFYSILVLIRRV